MTWTLRRKIILGYSIVLLLIVLVLAWAIINLYRLGQASNAILQENYNSIIAAENMIYALGRQDNAALLILLGRENEGLVQYRSFESTFLQWLGRAKDNITIEGEGTILTGLEQNYTNYLVAFSKMRTIMETNPMNAETFYDETVLSAFHTVYDACIHLREINQKTMFATSRTAERVAHRAMVSMLLIGFSAVGIGFAFSLVLSKMVTKPLARLTEVTNLLSEGEYNVQVPISSSDELGNLANDFNIMARKLKSFHDMRIERVVLEQRKSDAIITNIDDGLIFVNADFRIVNINPAAASLFNVDIHEAENRHFLEVINNEQLFSFIKEANKSEGPLTFEEDKNILTISQGDRKTHFQFSITPVFSAPGTCAGVVLLLRDVTRFKELDMLKSQFVMTASHELRTPLTSIIMSIDLLVEKAMGKLSEREGELLTVARDELYRLRILVNDLLELSRIESGKIDMIFEAAPLAVLIDKSLSVLMSQAEGLGIELSSSIPPDLPEVKADPNKITWVITNLVSNAFRYTQSGGFVEVTAEKFGNYVQVSVRDNGAGIPYEFQARIFDKFVQVKESGETGGSGLGLTICREIVHAHRGTIWVDSAPGVGSTFYFTLPVVNHS